MLLNRKFLPRIRTTSDLFEARFQFRIVCRPILDRVLMLTFRNRHLFSELRPQFFQLHIYTSQSLFYCCSFVDFSTLIAE